MKTITNTSDYFLPYIEAAHATISYITVMFYYSSGSFLKITYTSADADSLSQTEIRDMLNNGNADLERNEYEKEQHAANNMYFMHSEVPDRA